MRLGEAMVKEGLITNDILARALERQIIFGGRLGTNLVEMGAISEENLAKFLSKTLHVPYAEPAQFENVPQDALDAFPGELASKYTAFPILKERSMQAAAYLSGGEQQMLAIGRALMSNPKLLLLGEPSLGLAPKTFDLILEKVRAINADGATVLIAEQNARKVLRLADHCYVMENGAIAFHGAGAELMRDERIERTYLGATH